MLGKLSQGLGRTVMVPIRAGFSKSLSKISAVTEKLAKTVQGQIEYESSNPQDLQKFQQYYKSKGWTIKYNETVVEISKSSSLYAVHVLFNARTPISADEPEGDGQQPNAEQNQQEQMDYSDISICIKKNGGEKWLVASAQAGKDFHQISNVNFTKELPRQTVKPQSFAEYNHDGIYQGPEVASLDGHIQDVINKFVQNFGIDETFLQNISEFSLAYEQKFYLQWLKDIRAIL